MIAQLNFNSETEIEIKGFITGGPHYGQFLATCRQGKTALGWTFDELAAACPGAVEFVPKKPGAKLRSYGFDGTLDDQ